MLQLSIRKKITLIPIIGVIGFILNFSYAAIVNINNTERLGLIHTDAFPMVEKLYRIKLHHYTIKNLLNDSTRQNNLSPILEADLLAEENAQLLLSIVPNHPELQSLATKTSLDFKTYYNSARNYAVTAINNVPINSGDFILLQDQEQQYNNEYARLDTKIRGEFLEILHATREENDTYLRTSLILLSVLVVGLVSFSQLIASTISRTFREVINIAEAIARGDMSTAIPKSKDKETAQVLSAITAMRKEIKTANEQILFRERVSSTLNGNNYSNTYDNVLKLLQATCELSTCAIYSHKSGEGLRCIHYRIDSKTPISLELVNSINYAENVFNANHIVTACIISPIDDENAPTLVNGVESNHNTILFTGWPITFEDEIIGVFGTTHTTDLSPHSISLLLYAISRMGIFLHSNQLEDDRTKLINHLKENAKAMAEKNIEMAKISQAKSDFLANMSHELRTPLNVIIGFSKRLIRKKDQCPEHFVKPLEAICNNGESLAQTVNNLLKLSSMQIDALELDTNIIQLDEIIDGIQKKMGVQAEKKNVRLLTVNDIPGLRFPCDEEKICDILVNVLSNAIKFSTEGTITFHIFKDDKHLCFSVKDQGEGIDTEKQNNLFNNFHTIDTKQSVKVGLSGSGLGLAIVKKYVDLHNGTIECKSELGVGSEFIVRLPIVE